MSEAEHVPGEGGISFSKSRLYCSRGHLLGYYGTDEYGYCLECHRIAQRRWVRVHHGQPSMPLNAAYAAGLGPARLAAGMTQQQLADACGLTQTSIARWERERRPMSLRNRLRVAAALDVKPGELVLRRGSSLRG